jgi:hypothetical protein
LIHRGSFHRVFMTMEGMLVAACQKRLPAA